MTALETLLFNKLKDKMTKSGVKILPDMERAIERRSPDLIGPGDIEIEARSMKVKESFFYEDEEIDFGFSEAALYMVTKVADEIKKGEEVTVVDTNTFEIKKHIAEHNTEALFIFRGYFR